MTPDPELAAQYVVWFLAALVVLRSAWRIAEHVIEAVRFRRAIRRCARELEAAQRKALGDAIYRRMTTPRGSLPEDPGYGIDVRSFIMKGACHVCDEPRERGFCRNPKCRACVAWSDLDR
jgi:hypothetical protein